VVETCREIVEKEKLTSEVALKTEQNVCEMYINATGYLDTILQEGTL
jgi:hypothetical protein